MGTQQLTITFAGICSHFQDVVPGVPHRVVIPDASSVRFGLIQLAGRGEPAAYYVLPHFGIIKTTAPHPVTYSVPGLIKDGHIYGGTRLSVANAIDDRVSYDDAYQQVRSIQDFVARYNMSEEVVFSGRATAYFDIAGGVVSAMTAQPGGATQVIVTIQTDGPPKLAVSPFDSNDAPARPTIVPLQGPELLVGNMEIDPADSDPCFDYLLHYITALGGIPAVITHPTPGMGPVPHGRTRQEIARALEGLAKVIERGGLTEEQVLKLTPGDLTPACSDTRYP